MFKTRVIMGGVPRSGSSLIRSVLNGHPEILAPRETAIFIRDFASLQAKSDGFFQKVGDRLELPADAVKTLLTGSASRIEYFDRLMQAWRDSIAAVGSTAWLEKTPRNCLQYQSIAVEQPDAKFISTIRDGRDVVTSIFPDRSDYYCGIDRYVEAVEAVLAFKHPNHMIVKYEDFVSKTDESLRAMIEFLGLCPTSAPMEHFEVFA